jgi:hypothetical protein
MQPLFHVLPVFSYTMADCHNAAALTQDPVMHNNWVWKKGKWEKQRGQGVKNKH